MYLTTKRKLASSWMAYFVTGVAVFMVVGLVVGVVFFINGGISLGCILGVCFAAVCLGVLIYFNEAYTWSIGGKLEQKGRKLIYTYDDIVGLGNTKNTYTIRSIDRLKRGRRHVKVYGDMDVKMPLRSKKTVKKCVVSDCDDAGYQMLEEFMGK